MGERSPIKWLGGKGKLAPKILPLFPAHITYVEPFGGGAAVLLAKDPSPIEVYNDMNSALVNFFRVLRDEAKFERFHTLVSLTPYAREEFEVCRDSWEACEDDVERAYRWYVTSRMAFGGNFEGGSFGTVVTRSRAGMAETARTWMTKVDGLLGVVERLKRVQIEHADFRRVIERYDTPDTLFYLDPPYVEETRKAGQYADELSLIDHEDLVGLLLGIEGKAILSGYQHDVYRPLEDAGWKRESFDYSCHVAGRTKASGLKGDGSVLDKQKRIECVWISPSAQ